jgi:hypothetical protein
VNLREPSIIQDFRDGMNINDNPNIGDKERDAILKYIDALKDKIRRLVPISCQHLY